MSISVIASDGARLPRLPDPVRWKYHAIGNYFLNDVLPPRHGAI